MLSISNKTLLLLPLAIILVGCSDLSKAKAAAWSEKVCKPHLGVYKTSLPTQHKAATYCKDGTYFSKTDIQDYTGPDVAEHLQRITDGTNK